MPKESRCQSQSFEECGDCEVPKQLLLAQESCRAQVCGTKPKNVVVVNLPIADSIYRLRYGMHTDKIGDLARFFQWNNNLSRQVYVEGRSLDSASWPKLRKSTAYRFFIDGRWNRSDPGPQTKLLKYWVPKDMKLKLSDVKRLLKLIYTPDSHKDRIGYQTAWFNSGCLSNVIFEGTADRALPVLGGVNQFRIGSDTLSKIELRGIAHRLEMEFEGSERQIAESACAVDEEIIEKVFDGFNLTSGAQAYINKILS